MQKVIDSLFEEIKTDWDVESFSMFLSDIYALGCFDNEAEVNNQTLISLLPLMQSDVAQEYIMKLLENYGEEFIEGDEEDEDLDNS